MKKGGDFLKKVLFDGGTVPISWILSAAQSGNIDEPFRSSALRPAADLAADAARGGDLTKFERACDDAVTAVAAGAKRVPFGVESVIGYLVAKELEFTSVRIIMSSRMAGIGGDVIRERLREAYV
jgi:V/A-type H+-transporting ATPase subunit C